MKIVKELSGHSGCKVLLVQKEFLCVRKISANQQYNKRLELQMEKQKNFRHHDLKSPLILSNGYHNNLFYYDMEYIRGMSMFDYVNRENVKNIKSKMTRILNFIQNNNDLQESIQNEVVAKVNSLTIGDEFNYYKDFCLDYDWPTVKKSYCHGDLTFENILISNEDIYLIDFLDSFVETKVIDYSKIFQEIYAFWGFRNKSKKFNIKYIMIDEEIQGSIESKEAAIKFLVLNLLRIVPYSKGKDILFLRSQMDYVIGRNRG